MLNTSLSTEKTNTLKIF